jgi:hypothetical protein
MGNFQLRTAAAWLLVVTVAIWCQPTDLAAQPTADERPKILSVSVGLADCYKVGFWTPIQVQVNGAASLGEGRVDVRVIDSDGVMTTSEQTIPTTTSTSGMASVTVYTKVGRLGAPIEVVLSDAERPYDHTTLRAGRVSSDGTSLVELPPTAELIVTIGSDQIGLARAFADREESAGLGARQLLQLDSIADLPTVWFGYAAVDVLVISTGDIELCRQLADDAERFTALVKWIERGGRLVLVCGGANAEQLVAQGKPLSTLLPGRFVEVASLTETGPLEQFAEPAGPIPGRGAASSIRFPRLVDVNGAIEVYAGRRPTDPPLVVRSARGLGQITFAGVDLSKTPLAEWPDRHRFLQALLRPYISDGQPLDESQLLVARGYNDLSGALRQRLGQSFATLAPIGFPMVAVLAIAYLLVLGPVDYVVVRRWFRRPLVAWITFPIIVLAFGIGSVLLAEWRRGSAASRVNQLELVDFDLTTGLARGTYWAALHSPRARQFDLALRVEPFVATEQPHVEKLLSWWGLPGTGIGGMQTRAVNFEIVQSGYQYGPGLATLDAVPVVTLSTKSLTSRWTAAAQTPLEADLANQDGLLMGTITNKTGHTLRNARLLHGRWGYRLGNLADDGQIRISEELDPRNAKTILTSSVLSTRDSQLGQAQGGQFSAEQASTLELLNLMMFFQATGGLKFAQLPNQFQGDFDLSELLRPGIGRAILVAEVPGAGSRLVDRTTGAAIGDESDYGTVVYRFVIPVAGDTDQQ